MRLPSAICGLLAFAFAAYGQDAPEAVMIPDAWEDAGTTAVTPDRGVSGEYGTWTVTYTVGKGGIATGGGIRVELPDEWHSGPRNSAVSLQTKNAKADNYITANTSNGAAKLRCIVEDARDDALIKHPKKSLDGRSERYVFVVRVVVTEGALTEGDTIAVVYGDTSGGSAGYWASAVSAPPLPILIALDREGDSRFVSVSDMPSIEAVAGPPVYAQIHAPSNWVTGTPMTLRVALLDKEFNPASGPANFALTYPPGASGPDAVEVYRDHFTTAFEVTPAAEGVVRVAAHWAERDRELLGNPTEVSETAPERLLYWGDLHSHTQFSWDGVGQDGFAYARYSSGLDFYAMTDHSQEPDPGWDRGLNKKNWEAYSYLTEVYYDPGRFVTLHAYECSFGKPYGHHNVYFRGAPGALINPQTATLPELWKALVAGDALTIPHHTGKFPNGVDFTIHDPAFRRNIEMYSGHGLSEAYDPSHPLAFEANDFTADSSSAEGPVNAQDAWGMGLELSAIAASDDHRAHPGIAMYGLAAVRATSLTRNDVFQALYDRHTYATTGAKIILHFEVNGAPMGQRAPYRKSAGIHLVAHGTDTMEFVEILRLLPGEDTFTVVQRWEPNALDFEGTWDDPDTAAGAIYYMRVRQPKLIHKRVAMAWSSPVWVEK